MRTRAGLVGGKGFLVLTASLLLSQAAWATTYTIDQGHSTVSFNVRHLFAKVHGLFKDFQGTFDYVPGQPEAWKAEAVIQAASIDTRVEQRDAHLRNPDFLEVETYPTLTFKSTGVTEITATGAKLHGELTLHGVTKPVTLDLQVHGEGQDPWGGQRSGFTASTTINRKDFGLTWNKAVESGQLLVGEEVEIVLEIEGVAQ